MKKKAVKSEDDYRDILIRVGLAAKEMVDLYSKPPKMKWYQHESKIKKGFRLGLHEAYKAVCLTIKSELTRKELSFDVHFIKRSQRAL